MRRRYYLALLRHYLEKIDILCRTAALNISQIEAVARYFLRSEFRYRLVRRAPQSSVKSRFQLSQISALYINLNAREDRKVLVLSELARIGIRNVMRVQAVKTLDGHRGAALSHLAAIRYGAWMNWDYFMVLEDDGQFLVQEGILEEVIGEFLDNPFLDLLLIGNNTKVKTFVISPNLSIVSGSSSAGCYVAKRSAYNALRQTMSESAKRLESGGSPEIAAFDQLWKQDQQHRLCVAIPNTLVFKQRLSFSDTQKKLLEWPPSEKTQN